MTGFPSEMTRLMREDQGAATLMLIGALERSKGVMWEAARLLGYNQRTTIWEHVEKLGLKSVVNEIRRKYCGITIVAICSNPTGSPMERAYLIGDIELARSIMDSAIVACGAVKAYMGPMLGHHRTNIPHWLTRLDMWDRYNKVKRSVEKSKKSRKKRMGNHQTVCWMSGLIKGTDAQRVELRNAIEVALRSAAGSIEVSAGILGVSTATLRRYIIRLELDTLVNSLRPDQGLAREKGRQAGVRGGRPPAI